MMIPLRTPRERLKAEREWHNTFCLIPRRAKLSANEPLGYLTVGRCVRRRVPRDSDGMPPYIWVYMDRAHAASQKLIGAI